MKAYTFGLALLGLAFTSGCNQSVDLPNPGNPTPSVTATPSTTPSSSPSLTPSPSPTPSPSISPSPSVIPSPTAWQFQSFNEDLSSHAYLDPRTAPFDALMIGARGGACISARSLPATAGSSLTFSGCNGSAEQQIERVGSQLRIDGLCLTAQANQLVRLQPCGQANQNFESKAGGMIGLVGSNQVFDIAADDRVLTYGSHGGANQQFSFLSAIIDQVSNYPSASYPIIQAMIANQQAQQDMINGFQPPFMQLFDRSSVLSSFHGQVSPAAERVRVRFPIDRQFDNGSLRGWDPQVRNWVFSRSYAAPGDVIRIHVEGSAADADGLFAVINARTDTLRLGSGNSNNSLVRPSSISTKVALKAGDNYVRNPFGGSIIIESATSKNRQVWVEVSGGVRQPFFALGEHTALDWAEAKSYPGAFAILQSPQAAIGLYDRNRWNNIQDPVTFMENYERVAELSKDITGFVRGGQGVNRWPDGRQFLVQDVEISNGFAHAGFPIMAQPGFRIDRMQDSVFSWGVAHEIGHNYQHQCLSSYRYGVESTVNVWSTYVEENTYSGTPRIIRDKRFENAIARLNQAIHFDDFDVWDKLAFQMQMIYGLPGGWDNYRQAMRQLRALPESQRNQICNSPQAQYDIWYEVMSQVAGVNLLPHFERYKVPLSSQVKQRVAAQNLPMVNNDLSSLSRRPY